MARIPDAYFAAGFGQKLAQPQGVVGPDPSGGQAIAAAAQNLGGAVTDFGTDLVYEKSQAKKAQLDEFERLEKLRRDSEARSSLFTHENTLGQVVDELARDKELTPKEKRDQFKEQSDKVRTSFEQTVPEEYRYAFGPAFDEHRTRAESALDGHLRKELQDGTRANGLVAREALLNSAKPLGEKLALIKDPDAFDWEAEGYSEEDRAKVVASLAEQATEGEVAQRLNQDDPRQVLKALRETTGEGGDYARYNDLTPKTRQAYIRTAKAMIDQQEADAARRAKEGKTARDDAAKNAFERYKEMREGLFPIDPKQEAAFWKTVGGTDYEDRARDVRKTTGALGFVTDKIRTDPLKYGAAQMGFDVPQLSLDDPTSWPEQLTARAEIAASIKASAGLPYLPVLTNDEAAGLSGMFKTQAPLAQINTIKALQQGLGTDSVKQMARQFAASDRDLGMIVGLVTAGRAPAAYHVAEGRRLLTEKAVPMTAALQVDMRTRFDNTVDDALTGLPQVREGFHDAVTAAYLSLQSGREVADGTLNKKAYDEALLMVLGGEPAKVNGKKVLLPDGISEAQFLTNIKRIDAATVESAGGVLGFASAGEAAEAIRDDAELWEAGNGRYRFAVDGRFLMTPEGKTFELNLADMAGMKFPVRR
jgi:hypothetical protein